MPRPLWEILSSQSWMPQLKSCTANKRHAVILTPLQNFHYFGQTSETYFSFSSLRAAFVNFYRIHLPGSAAQTGPEIGHTPQLLTRYAWPKPWPDPCGHLTESISHAKHQQRRKHTSLTIQANLQLFDSTRAGWLSGTAQIQRRGKMQNPNIPIVDHLFRRLYPRAFRCYSFSLQNRTN